jgi:hypothetical protein
MGCLGFTIAGGALEVVGFGLVAAEITRMQWREFGTPQALVSLEGKVRRILRRPLPDLHDEGTLVTRARLEGKGWREYATEPEDFESLREHVAQIAADLRGEIRDEATLREQTDERIRQRVVTLEGDVARQRQATEQARKAEMRRHIAVQGWGTALFILGATFAVLGNAVSC